LPEEPAAGCEPVPSPAGDRREGRDGRGQTGNQEIAMTNDHAPFLSPDPETDDEPHTLSPTAHLLDELALYGYRPGKDEPDPRPLPEADAVRAHIGEIVDGFAAMLTDTRLQDDLDDLLWSFVNLFHRKIARVEQQLMPTSRPSAARSWSRMAPRCAPSSWNA